MKTNTLALLSTLALAMYCCSRPSTAEAPAPAPPAIPAPLMPAGTNAPMVAPAAPNAPTMPTPMAMPGAMPSGDEMIVGNGQSLSQPRALAGFTRVENVTSLDVHVTQGPAFSVVVTADANIVPVITTTLVNGALTIASNHSFSTRAPSRVDVTLVQFDGADNGGSGSLEVTASQSPAVALRNRGSGALVYQGQAGAMTLDLRGSGTTTLSGSAASLVGTRVGSGELVANAFPVRGATFTSTGSGNANLTVRGDAHLTLQGSGDIHAAIDDGTADLSVVGSGHITWSGTATVGRANAVGSGGIVHGS